MSAETERAPGRIDLTSSIRTRNG
ncbi:MAG: hypothetical protein ACD_43C00278G0001, partial [uncultured bacterium]